MSVTVSVRDGGDLESDLGRLHLKYGDRLRDPGILVLLSCPRGNRGRGLYLGEGSICASSLSHDFMPVIFHFKEMPGEKRASVFISEVVFSDSGINPDNHGSPDGISMIGSLPIRHNTL
jgi:hypothetical protein